MDSIWISPGFIWFSCGSDVVCILVFMCFYMVLHGAVRFLLWFWYSLMYFLYGFICFLYAACMVLYGCRMVVLCILNGVYIC